MGRIIFCLWEKGSFFFFIIFWRSGLRGNIGKRSGRFMIRFEVSLDKLVEIR